MKGLYDLYNKIRDNQEIKLSYDQWVKFLSIAYGTFHSSEQTFLTHTYLSILSKLLAFVAIENNISYESETILSILNGDAFKKYNVNNFSDNDFYRWILDINNFNELIPVIHIILKQLSLFKFSSINEDILKGVYQELIDEDTRHGLGEFYTPDWLCTKIVKTLGIKPDSKILDPACGSGSFLKAVANELCELKADISAKNLNDCLYGIDIHPLSVQISKATVLMILGKRLLFEKAPINLHIYLSNTLLLPNYANVSLLERHVYFTINNITVNAPVDIFNNSIQYDLLVQNVNDLSEKDVLIGEKKDADTIHKIFKVIFKSDDPILLNTVYKIYDILYEAKATKNNGIWAYILFNLYRPFFFSSKFDFVIGNPPWITFSDIKNSEYQNNLRNLAKKYKMLPSANNIPHLEISALFFAHSINYFLNDSGKIAMVLPRSFFAGSQHEPTRIEYTSNVNINEIWDLKDVNPLFKVPTCVLFAEKKVRIDLTPEIKTITGKIIKATFSKQNISFIDSKLYIEESSGQFYLSKLGTNTAWTYNNYFANFKINYYKDKFHQGATIVPRVFYFVDIDQEYDGDLKNRILVFRSSSIALNDAKKPWKFELSNRASTNYLFTTTLSNCILPFTIINLRKILLPLQINDNKPVLLSPKEIEESGDLYTSTWFREVEVLWEKYKTETNKNYTALQYLNYRNKILNQNFSAKFSVLYNTSGTNICSAVLNKNMFVDFPFIIECNLYYFDTNDENEAYYVSSFLNSPNINQLVKPFQSGGLFGERHIHKKILNFGLPCFDKSNANHLKLANLGKQASDKATRYMAHFGKKFDINAITTNKLGKLRSDIRTLLSSELEAIDSVLNIISKT
jgi:type I restriction-modification system DNA methylase subunit